MHRVRKKYNLQKISCQLKGQRTKAPLCNIFDNIAEILSYSIQQSSLDLQSIINRPILR